MIIQHIVPKLFQTALPNSISDLLNPKNWLLNSFGSITTSGQTITPEKAMQLSAYFACIRVISEDLGKIPLIVYRRLKPRGKERATKKNVYKILHDIPNPDMTPISFKETLTQYALGWGDGVAEIVMNRMGEPAALYPIHPSRVSILRDENKKIIYKVSLDNFIDV